MTGPGTATERARAVRKLKRPRKKTKTNLWREEEAGPETRPAGLVFRLGAFLLRVLSEGVDAWFGRPLTAVLLTVPRLAGLVARWTGILLLSLGCRAREGLGRGLGRDLEAHTAEVGDPGAVGPGMSAKAAKEARGTLSTS